MIPVSSVSVDTQSSSTMTNTGLTGGTSGSAATTECVILVLLEMGLSFFGIVSNLLIVSTLRNPKQEERLNGSTINYLLFNLCFSNLVISFLVKPISAIYVGYAVTTGEAQVGLAFCTLYNFTYRTTWCVFPFTLIAMCWSKLLSQCRCSRCGVLCCKKRKTLAKLTKFQSEKSPVHLVPETAPQPVTELLQIRANRLTTNNSFQRESSVSTPTPSNATSNTPELNNLQQNGGNSTQDANNSQLEPMQEMVPNTSRVNVRTLSDGPTARQKILVVSIWIFSSLFGILTCFPGKFVTETADPIAEQLQSTIKPFINPFQDKDYAKDYPLEEESSDQVFLTNNLDSNSEPNPKMAATDHTAVELSYCSVKNGVNDMLDYIALVVALVAPFIIGPCIVGVFQGIFAIFGRFVCSRGATDRSDGSRLIEKEETGPGWLIIISFTVVFLGTYPLHMYVAEMYLKNDFSFLLVKYFVGFLYVILIPMITLIAQKEIRSSVADILRSPNVDTSCDLPDVD